LVEEIHNKQQHDADQESQRRRLVVRAAKAGRRAKVRNRVLALVAVVASLVAVAFGVKEFAENRRIEQGLAAAQEPLTASSVAKLEAARTVLGTNLDVAPGHPATLGRIALVVIHLHIRGAVDAEQARVALENARAAGRPEGALCEGMLAALEGDFDQARRAYEGALADEDPWVRADAAWLQAVVALGHPYDVAMEDAAVAQLEASLQETPSASNLRALATLVARRGDLEVALSRTAEARALAPEDTGLSVDEAFFKVLKAESVVGVLELVGALEHTVRGPDVARLSITKGLAMLHEGEPSDGVEALSDAWRVLSPADNDARLHVLEGLLSYGQVDRVDALRKGVHLGSQADGVVDAWEALAQGRSQEALAALEAMPQTLPRVGHLQALALVEQHRHDEARSWVEFARQRLPDRPDLAVAAARVAIAADESQPAALEELEALADAHPWTYRVWTGLAEARLAALDAESPDPESLKEAVAALERAIDHEAAPAEASFRLAKHYASRIFDEPEDAAVALKHFRVAAETPPKLGTYRATYGTFLVQLARAREAREVLMPLVDDVSLGPGPLLDLARASSTDASLRGTPVDEGVLGWLTEAATRGADPAQLELEWARYELARRNPQALQQARVRLETLVTTHPRNVEIRGLYATSLLALGEPRLAKVTVRDGIRRTLRTLDGRLYVVDARIELAGRQKRRAASLAYKGWRKMVREPNLPVGALLDTAPFVAGLWMELGQPKAAATVGRGLTLRAPVSPRAWVLRGGIELAGERPGAACTSADRAVELDERLPSGWGLRGDCLTALGEYATAIRSYDRAVNLAEGTVAERALKRKLASAKRKAKRK
ncbi:MAG: hypothetical protein KUG77_11095, partial [Nannocystaceae bacterium]|nr:hypothetical protein [Nannocystaceae bacterium]